MSNDKQISTNGNFIRAMIRIANPTFTPEQIEVEYEKKIKEKENDESNCEMCSG